MQKSIEITRSPKMYIFDMMYTKLKLIMLPVYSSLLLNPLQHPNTVFVSESQIVTDPANRLQL